jgi:thermostable 8-oxoguanine DNA glycosylase
MKGRKERHRLIRRLYVWAILTSRESHPQVLKAMDKLPHNLGSLTVDEIGELLHSAGIHYWKTKAKWLHELAITKFGSLFEPFLANTPEETRDLFMRVKGIGRKTASMLTMFIRKDAKMAILDTHVVNWLNENVTNIAKVEGLQLPRDTILVQPLSLEHFEYDALERIFLDAAEAKKMHPLELDFEIWAPKAGSTKLVNTSVGWRMPGPDWEAISK